MCRYIVHTYPCPMLDLVQPLLLAQSVPLPFSEESEEDLDEPAMAKKRVHLPSVDPGLLPHHLTHDLPQLHHLLVSQTVFHHRLGNWSHVGGGVFDFFNAVDPNCPSFGLKHSVVSVQSAIYGN